MRYLNYFLPRPLRFMAVFLLLAGAATAVWAQENSPTPPPPTPHSGSPLHPTFPLLDINGQNVLDSGAGVSPMQTCGSCHDTTFIAQHSFHADVGLATQTAAGQLPQSRPWETSTGLFGRWDPITYRTLSPMGDERLDLTTADWQMTLGARHVGGGPAVIGRNGQPLASLVPTVGDMETGTRGADGQWQAWDWNTSGTAEMNCFLCHLPESDNASRVQSLADGQFGWAATATLAQTTMVTHTAEGWAWNTAAFDPNGNLLPELVTVQDPTNANCGQCHGVVQSDPNTPLVLENYGGGDYTSLTTGQIFSPQRMDQSGLNLADKQTLSRSWDVHAERVVQCTNCHYALNNPVYYQEGPDKPAHLAFDPRRLDFGDYLYRPLHQFASGTSPQSNLAAEFDNTLRSCQSCHNTAADHGWLPYLERHTAALSCQSCHVPQLYGPALSYIDWTVLVDEQTPVQAYRSTATGHDINSTTLLTGYEPVLLPRPAADGTAPLTPFNLIASWYWVYGDPARPVPLPDLQAAWFTAESTYQPALLATFDTNHDGQLSQDELQISNTAQETAVANRLRALGLANPRIMGEVQPYTISHNVTQGEWVTRSCQTCHTADSRLSQPLPVADRLPGGVMPTLMGNGVVQWAGELQPDTTTGGLLFQPQPATADLYVLGHGTVAWVDRLGVALFTAVLSGIVIHGGARVLVARRQTPAPAHAGPRVYMYDVYERLWHWLQTAAILLLIFTGLIIHKPDQFGLFSFAYVVQVHNVLAAVLVINAALSLFYHLVSGEIRQFLPRPRGFFDQAIVQTRYYLRGIFKGEDHPIAKSRDHKLNPLQQITYLIILNILLPLQIITGALMWGTQRWPELVQQVGGLPFLAPFHSLIAWLFTSFIILHVYLTTTGHTPLAGIKAMMLGWEEGGGVNNE